MWGRPSGTGGVSGDTVIIEGSVTVDECKVDKYESKSFGIPNGIAPVMQMTASGLDFKTTSGTALQIVQDDVTVGDVMRVDHVQPKTGGGTLTFSTGAGAPQARLLPDSRLELASSSAKPYKMPGIDGTAGYALTTNGIGTLGWTSLVPTTSGATFVNRTVFIGVTQTLFYPYNPPTLIFSNIESAFTGSKTVPNVGFPPGSIYKLRATGVWFTTTGVTHPTNRAFRVDLSFGAVGDVNSEIYQWIVPVLQLIDPGLSNRKYWSIEVTIIRIDNDYISASITWLISNFDPGFEEIRSSPIAGSQLIIIPASPLNTRDITVNLLYSDRGHGSESLIPNFTSYTIDLATPQPLMGEAPATIQHSVFQGLTTGDAGHQQFPMLQGRSGGQHLYGGHASGEHLNLIPNTSLDAGSVIVRSELHMASYTSGGPTTITRTANVGPGPHNIGTVPAPFTNLFMQFINPAPYSGLLTIGSRFTPLSIPQQAYGTIYIKDNTTEHTTFTGPNDFSPIEGKNIEGLLKECQNNVQSGFELDILHNTNVQVSYSVTTWADAQFDTTFAYGITIDGKIVPESVSYHFNATPGVAPDVRWTVAKTIVVLVPATQFIRCVMATSTGDKTYVTDMSFSMLSLF